MFRKAADCKEISVRVSNLNTLGGVRGSKKKRNSFGVALNPPKEEGGGDNQLISVRTLNLAYIIASIIVRCNRFMSLLK